MESSNSTEPNKPPLTWYVYVYRDPINNAVFYVGEGKGNRCKSHLYRATTWQKQNKPCPCGSLNLHLMRKILKIRESNVEPIVEIVSTFNDEQLAYDFEIQQIKFYGLDNLCNLTNGGEGLRISDERRKQLSDKRKEWLKTEAGIACCEKYLNLKWVKITLILVKKKMKITSLTE